MATIETNREDLEKLIGKKLKQDKLHDELFDMKMELDREDNGIMSIEVEYDRADLLSTEGIARQMKGYYGIETGLKKYDFKDSKSTTIIDEEMKKYRPYAYHFLALNVPFNDDAIRQIMQIQEKLHMIYAKDRELASIGVYDFDKTSKNFKYKPMKPNEIKFIPLESKKQMTGKQILEEHPKGIAFAHLLKSLDKYPVLMDDKGKIMSMPPIINSEDTKVDENTKNLFIDVSGTDEKTVNMITTIIATMLAERGAEIQNIKIKYGKDEFSTPKIEYKEKRISPEMVKKTIGTNIDNFEIVRLLKKQRFSAEIREGQVIVIVPCYRFDIIHDIDLIEEIACAYGLNNMKPVLPNVATIGEVHKVEKKTKKARDIMTGLGFQELATFILSGKESLERAKSKDELAELKNPVSEEYNVIRNSLIPKMLEFLQKNKHYELPQKVFETGEVLKITNKGEQKTECQKHICGAIISETIGFTDIKSVCESLLKNIKIEVDYIETNDERFLYGRCAEIKHNDKIIGIIGEINPDILEKFDLENPVAVFELNIEKML